MRQDQRGLFRLTYCKKETRQEKLQVSLDHTGKLFSAHFQQIILDRVTVATREDNL